MKVEALVHKNSTAIVSINTWQIRGSRWYSNISNRAHTAVTEPRIAAEIFLSLHRRISAAASQWSQIAHIPDAESEQHHGNNVITTMKRTFFTLNL